MNKIQTRVLVHRGPDRVQGKPNRSLPFHFVYVRQDEKGRPSLFHLVCERQDGEDRVGSLHFPFSFCLRQDKESPPFHPVYERQEEKGSPPLFILSFIDKMKRNNPALSIFSTKDKMKRARSVLSTLDKMKRDAPPFILSMKDKMKKEWVSPFSSFTWNAQLPDPRAPVSPILILYPFTRSYVPVIHLTLVRGPMNKVTYEQDPNKGTRS